MTCQDEEKLLAEVDQWLAKPSIEEAKRLEVAANISKILGAEGSSKIAEIAGNYIRDRLRETSLARQILPVTQFPLEKK